MGQRERGSPQLEITSLSAIVHILTHCPDRIERIAFSGAHPAGRAGEIHTLAKRNRITVEMGGRPDGAGEIVKAYLTPFRYHELRDFTATLKNKKSAVVLALDHLQDPQNFGALCRTAEGLGIAGILLPKDRSVAVGPGVYNASVGAVETLPIVMVANLADGLRKLKESGFWIVGAAIGPEAHPPWQMPTFEKIALVLGTEYEGLTPTIEKLCDWKIEIPLTGHVQSLNVSVAGGILMYHLQNRENFSPNKPMDKSNPAD
jgi:23S rRNA (guanosine2251-2'-O)-methyltransferase